MTKDNQIKKEYKRIHSLYENLPADSLELLEPMIQNAAFMKVSLSGMQSDINSCGCTEEYQNGKEQTGMKQSATLQSYIALMKLYNSTIELLNKKLPPGTKNSKLENFLND